MNINCISNIKKVHKFTYVYCTNKEYDYICNVIKQMEFLDI